MRNEKFELLEEFRNNYVKSLEQKYINPDREYRLAIYSILFKAISLEEKDSILSPDERVVVEDKYQEVQCTWPLWIKDFVIENQKSVFSSVATSEGYSTMEEDFALSMLYNKLSEESQVSFLFDPFEYSSGGDFSKVLLCRLHKALYFFLYSEPCRLYDLYGDGTYDYIYESSWSKGIEGFQKFNKGFQKLSKKGIMAVTVDASHLYFRSPRHPLYSYLKSGNVEQVIALPKSKSAHFGCVLLMSKQVRNVVKFTDWTEVPLSNLNGMYGKRLVPYLENLLAAKKDKLERSVPLNVVLGRKTLDPYYYFTDILFDDENETIFLSEIANEVQPIFGKSTPQRIDREHSAFTKSFPVPVLSDFNPYTLGNIYSSVDQNDTRFNYKIETPSVFYSVEHGVASYTPSKEFLQWEEDFVDEDTGETILVKREAEVDYLDLLTDASVLNTRNDKDSFLSRVCGCDKRFRKYTVSEFTDDYLISVLLDEQTQRQSIIECRKIPFDCYDKPVHNIFNSAGYRFTQALLNFKVKKRDKEEIFQYINQTKGYSLLDDGKSNTCNIIVVGEKSPQIKNSIKFEGELNVVECITEQELKSQLSNLYKDFHAVVFNVTRMADPKAELKSYVRCVHASGKKACFVTMDATRPKGFTQIEEQYWYPFTDMCLLYPVYTLTDSNEKQRFSELIVESTLSSTDNEINKRFGDILEYIKDNPKGSQAYKKIVGSILFPEKYNIDAYLYFNPLRSLVEDVFRKMNSLGYLDDRFIENNVVNITDSYKYLTGQVTGVKTKKVQYGKEKKSVFPPLMCNIIRQLVEVGNIESHSDGYYDKISDNEFKDYCEAQGYYEVENSLLLLQSLALQLGTVIKFVYSGKFRECTTKEEPVYSGEHYLDEFIRSHKDGKLRNVTLLQESDAVFAKIQLSGKDILVKTPFSKLPENETVILENFRVNTDKESFGTYPLFAYVDRTSMKQ